MIKSIIILALMLFGLFASIKLFVLFFLTPESEVYEEQSKMSEKWLNGLILTHESKRLVCEQILVSKVFKQVLKFNQYEAIADSNPNFLGSWMGVPVFYSPALNDGDAVALSDNPGFPSTTMSEVKI